MAACVLGLGCESDAKHFVPEETSPDGYDYRRAGLQVFEPEAGRAVPLGQAELDSRIGRWLRRIDGEFISIT